MAKESCICAASFWAWSRSRASSRDMPTWASPDTRGSAATFSSVSALSCAGSAPTRSMMASRLRSSESSRAFSRWTGATSGASLSDAMPTASCRAAWAVMANLSSLMVYHLSFPSPSDGVPPSNPARGFDPPSLP